MNEQVTGVGEGRKVEALPEFLKRHTERKPGDVYTDGDKVLHEVKEEDKE